MEYAKNNAKFEKAINVRFGKPVFEKELDEIESRIDAALDGISDYRNHDSWGDAYVDTNDITTEIRERAEQGHIKLAFAEIELLYRKLLENFEYQGECEISQEAEICLEIMSEIADLAVLKEDKDYIFEQCLGLADLEEGKDYGADYEDKLLKIASKFVTSENRTGLETALSNFDSRWLKKNLS